MFREISTKIGQAVLKSAAASVPTLTIAAVAGLSPGLIVGLGATAFLSALGIALPSVAEYVGKRQELKKNFVHYLWKLQR